ncbi:MAG: hypothetical protein M1358_05320, partial [Chloroflexi bacterium]|nr:hypothetical protein [Chloroflexota bacterium]
MKRIIPLLAGIGLIMLALRITTYAENPTPTLTPQVYLPLVANNVSEQTATASPTATATATATSTATSTPTSTPSSSLIINQQHVDVFSQIPDNAVAN